MICRRLWLCILAAVLGSAAGGGKRYQEEEKVGAWELMEVGVELIWRWFLSLRSQCS